MFHIFIIVYSNRIWEIVTFLYEEDGCGYKYSYVWISTIYENIKS